MKQERKEERRERRLYRRAREGGKEEREVEVKWFKVSEVS